MTKLVVWLGCNGVPSPTKGDGENICKLCEGGSAGTVTVPDDLVDELTDILEAGWGVGKFLDDNKDRFDIENCSEGGIRFLTSTIEREP